MEYQSFDFVDESVEIHEDVLASGLLVLRIFELGVGGDVGFEVAGDADDELRDVSNGGDGLIGA